METVFDELALRMKIVREGITGILRDAFNEAAPVIEDKIIEQLKRGERGDGKMLPDYSPTSVNVYGKRPGPMTLEDTGEFHHDITARADDSGLEITDPNWKTPMLEMHYGSEIIELQERSFDELKPEILDDVIHERIDKFLQR